MNNFYKGFHSFVIILLGLSVLQGCSGGSTDGSSTATGPNIYGLVSSTSISKVTSKAGGVGTLVSNPVSGCTITAYDLVDDTEVASTTTDDNGQYILKGNRINSGENYKIMAECGSNSFATVASADELEPNASQKSPKSTDPRSTVVAAMVIKAIFQAVDGLATDLGNSSIANTIKQSIVDNLDSIMAPIVETIEEAISSGAMAEPTTSDTSTIASGIKTAGDATAIDSAIGSYTEKIPAAVDQAATGATSGVSALGGCDPTINTLLDQNLCTKSLMKFFYNALGFPVLINKASGAFGAITTCNDGSSDSVLLNAFPNSSITEGGQVPSGMCMIKSKLGKVSRNGEDTKGGEDGGPIFGESHSTSLPVGFISKMSQSLLAGYRYNLSDLDRIVFDYSSSAEAGMNSRIFGRTFNSSNGQDVLYFRKSDESWVEMSTYSASYIDGDSCSGGCAVNQVWNIPFSGTASDWTDLNSSIAPNSALNTMVGDIKAGSSIDLKIFSKKYAGPVPTWEQIETDIDTARIHREYNPTGPKELWVAYEKAPKSDGTDDGCWDQDPTTACAAQDGSGNYPALRVNLAFGTKVDGLTPISGITASASGAYYIRPIYNQGGFSGILSFIDASNGRILRDEFMNERGILIGDTDRCGNTSDFPQYTGITCSNGKAYNVILDWSQCDGFSNCPKTQVPTGQGSGFDPTGFSFNVAKDYKSNFDTVGYSLVGAGNWDNQQALVGQINGSFAIVADTLTFGATQINSSSVLYGFSVNWDCTSGSQCVPKSGEEFVAVDETGNLLTDGSAGHCSGNTIWGTSNVCVFSETQLRTLSTSDDFDPENSRGFDLMVVNKRVYEGPMSNPGHDCTKQAFYLETNSTSGYQCSTGSPDLNFASQWEYEDWKHRNGCYTGSPAASCSLVLIPNENGYKYDDPIGFKKLLSTAFNGWFGTKIIDGSTTFDAFQAFALIFMYFEESSRGDIDGLAGQNGLPSTIEEFNTESPLFNDDALANINKYIGNAIIEFRRQ